MTRRGITVLSVSVAALILGVGLWPRGPTTRVGSGPVGERSIARAEIVAMDGIARAFGPATGRVVAVVVREGARVTSGQRLAEIDADGKTTEVVAPIAGVVVSRRADPGDDVAALRAAGTPLFELAETRKTETRIELEEVLSARVRVGMPVIFRAPGGAVAGRGAITRLADRVEPRTLGAPDARVRGGGLIRRASATFRAEPCAVCDACPPCEALPLGSSLEAEIEVARRDAPLRLPRAALAIRDGRAVVEVPLGPLGPFRRELPVKVEATDAVFAEVTGIPHGTLVFLRER